ncbi:MAG: hypothetical protein EOO20_19745, partial [Chryseobacterium sp.]
MKINYSPVIFLVLLSTLFPLMVCGQNRAQTKNTGDDFITISQQFLSPDRQYGSVPFFVWNTKVTKEEINSMLVSYKAQSFGGVFIHARSGLITEYLSDEWFELCRYTTERGKQLGLDIWLYDENSYPSGFAGGHVPSQMPESYNQGQMLGMEKKSTLPADAGKYMVVIKSDNNKLINITNQLAAEKGKVGSYFLFTKQYNKPDPF